jgi:hypothetical protein
LRASESVHEVWTRVGSSAVRGLHIPDAAAAYEKPVAIREPTRSLMPVNTPFTTIFSCVSASLQREATIGLVTPHAIQRRRSVDFVIAKISVRTKCVGCHRQRAHRIALSPARRCVWRHSPTRQNTEAEQNGPASVPLSQSMLLQPANVARREIRNGNSVHRATTYAGPRKCAAPAPGRIFGGIAENSWRAARFPLPANMRGVLGASFGPASAPVQSRPSALSQGLKPGAPHVPYR